MTALTYGDLATKTYGDLANMTYGFENTSGGGVTSADIAAIAQAVWDYSSRTLTSNTGGSGATAQQVWEYANRSLTSPVALTDAYNAAKNAASASSVSTLQTAVSALPDASANATAVWGATARTLTASPTDVSGLASSISTLQTAVAAIPTTAAPTAQNIWEYSSRTLTSSTGGGGATAQEVWEYSARTLTASPTDISGLASSLSTLQTSVSAIPTTSAPTAQNIWEFSSRTLTSGGGGNSGITAADVWEYSDRTLTASPTNVSGLATASAVTALQGDVTAIKAKTDTMPALATLLEKIFSLVAHWSVSGNTLTIYDSQNNSLGTFTLTRNIEGEITGVH